jgi:diaminohydroxyphosphoribosylaminopyrimidine deaminase/5-amino-6-(5-phosphoribosylamino)uracil reductase
VASDHALMTRALELAAATHPHPNPRVGAVVVDRQGVVAGEGSHAGPGHPHAEVIALEQAGSRAEGGTLYATLEPCVHTGRTPPCVPVVVAAGITRVVFAATDPDSRVAGAGAGALEAAGLTVAGGLLSAEAELLDPAYFHHRRTGRPLVTLKIALTLDGQTAPRDGASRWITGAPAREDAHQLRAAADAVMVGAGTVIADDPSLDVRLDGYDGPQPRPVVVAGRRPLDPSARIFSRHPVVITSSPLNLPGQVLEVSPGEDGLPDLAAALAGLAALGLLAVLVEGGSGLAAALWARRLVDRGVFYLAGTVAGGSGRPAFAGTWPTLSAARPVILTGVRQIGDDLRIDFQPRD